MNERARLQTTPSINFLHHIFKLKKYLVAFNSPRFSKAPILCWAGFVIPPLPFMQKILNGMNERARLQTTPNIGFFTPTQLFPAACS